jgi:uncharacterized protein YkwD
MLQKIMIIIGLVVLAVFGYHNRTQLLSYVDSIGHGKLPASFLNRVAEENFLPAPLRARVEAAQSHLTADGVVEWTNKQREQNGLTELRVNEKLNAAAEAKLRDMFAQQYFEHNSPQGVTPADLIKQFSYAYVVVGENLALGNFKDDQVLVQAWMDSPGHRANILHHRFQEIGVAVGQSVFEGRTVWLAVQEFGTPLSSCPSVSSGMKQQIEADKQRIDSLNNQATTLRSQIESGAYDYDQQLKRQKIEEYNNLVAELNSLAEQSKENIADYNSEVEKYNKCLEDQ